MTNGAIRQRLWCRYFKYLLVFSWCLGLLFGAIAARFASDSLIPLIRRSLICPASITGSLVSAVLPFLLSAYAVSFSEPWLLLPISSLKAFGFAFCALGVNFAFGSAGWLVRLLFLFSDVCLIPVLFFYWLRQIRDAPQKPVKELISYILFAAFIGLIDVYLISPFSVRLIDF